MFKSLCVASTLAAFDYFDKQGTDWANAAKSKANGWSCHED
jgi:hypothetical protein